MTEVHENRGDQKLIRYFLFALVKAEKSLLDVLDSTLYMSGCHSTSQR